MSTGTDSGDVLGTLSDGSDPMIALLQFLVHNSPFHTEHEDYGLWNHILYREIVEKGLKGRVAIMPQPKLFYYPEAVRQALEKDAKEKAREEAKAKKKAREQARAKAEAKQRARKKAAPGRAARPGADHGHDDGWSSCSDKDDMPRFKRSQGNHPNESEPYIIGGSGILMVSNSPTKSTTTSNSPHKSTTSTGTIRSKNLRKVITDFGIISGNVSGVDVSMESIIDSFFQLCGELEEKENRKLDRPPPEFPTRYRDYMDEGDDEFDDEDEDDEDKDPTYEPSDSEDSDDTACEPDDTACEPDRTTRPRRAANKNKPSDTPPPVSERTGTSSAGGDGLERLDWIGSMIEEACWEEGPGDPVLNVAHILAHVLHQHQTQVVGVAMVGNYWTWTIFERIRKIDNLDDMENWTRETAPIRVVKKIIKPVFYGTSKSDTQAKRMMQVVDNLGLASTGASTGDTDSQVSGDCVHDVSGQSPVPSTHASPPPNTSSEFSYEDEDPFGPVSIHGSSENDERSVPASRAGSSPSTSSEDLPETARARKTKKLTKRQKAQQQIRDGKGRFKSKSSDGLGSGSTQQANPPPS
ncbi:hypothetical protein EV714DRAFT_269204 [Schizophyllum commune]